MVTQREFQAWADRIKAAGWSANEAAAALLALD